MARRWRYFAEEVDGAVKVTRSDTIKYLACTPSAAVENLIPKLVHLANCYERRAKECRDAIDAIRAGKVTRTWKAKP